MLWLKEFVKSDWGKVLVLVFTAFATIFLLIFFLLKVDRQPTQTAHVEVVSKRWIKGGRYSASAYYFATFKFPDGTEQEFNLRTTKFISEDEETYASLQNGDKGTLTYKQLGDGTGPMGNRFVSFEKDEAPVKELTRNSWYLANLET